jgi:lipopolysaccharide biosynthesis glycosyltransferase
MKVFVGYDVTEDVAYKVCEFSIKRHTRAMVDVRPLIHTDLRKAGLFRRPWLTEAETGHKSDLVDGRPFSTDFSHTRFLVPHLCEYGGWALFMDCDMIFTSDIAKLFDLVDDRYAVMVVKHKHVPTEREKMDGQIQHRYFRKNWSSFMLINCAHPANRALTPGYVNMAAGGKMHAFDWLGDEPTSDRLIGELPRSYNWIDGSSPIMPGPTKSSQKVPLPDVIHYTVGGPWFPNCRRVKYCDVWIEEYERWQASGNYAGLPTSVPTTRYEMKFSKG